MPSKIKEYWDEFDWEREIRKDDERVHTYLSELPDFIDLPQEDAMIYKRIKRRPELVPGDGVWPDFLHEPEDDELIDPGDEPPPDSKAFEANWQEKDGADVYIEVSKLAADVAIVFAEEKIQSRAIRYMQITCLLGKIAARAADVIRMEPGDMPAFRIAFGKRFLSDLNLMIGLFRSMDPVNAEDNAKVEGFVLHAYQIREQVMKLIRKARSEQNRSGFFPDTENR